MTPIRAGACLPIFACPGHVAFRTPSYRALDRIEELRLSEVAQLYGGSTGHLGPTASALSVAEVVAESRQRWLFGTPDEVIDQIRVYRELGVNHLMLWFFDAPDPAGVRLFAEKVRPALR